MAWNRPTSNNVDATSSSRPSGRDRKPGLKHGILAGAIIIVLGALCCFIFSGNETRQDAASTKGRGRIREVAPAKAPKAAGAETRKEEPQIPIGRPTKPGAPYRYDTNKWQEVDGFIIPVGARLIRNSLTNKVRRVFNHMSDTMIAEVLQPPEGGVMPPPPPITAGMHDKFLKSLDDPIVINDDDTPEVKEQKESVIIARAQIKERIDNGERFEDILREHWTLTEDNLKIKRNAQKELDAIYAQGDRDGAAKYKRVMDVALSQMGISELDEPSTPRERAAARRAVRKALKEQSK